MALELPPRLSCGRLLDDVWDHVGDPPDAHERSCEYCQDARAALAPLASTTADLRNQEETDEDFRIGPRVKAAVIEIARAEVRRSRRLPLEQPETEDIEIDLTISEQVVAGVVRNAADRDRLVRARRCSVDLDKAGSHLEEPGPAASGVRPAAVSLTVRITTASGTAIPDVVDRLRDRVADAVQLRTGLTVSRIDVVVEDLFDA